METHKKSIGSRRFDASCIRLGSSLVDAMKAIQKGAVGIALVIGKGDRLVGTLTDGDIRRALLAGRALSDSLDPFINREFTAVGPEAGRVEVLDLMQARSISQVPVVDKPGRLVGLHLLRELLGAVERSNWAVIMAGGQGLRLRPITEKIPKPMIKVAGRPILERLVLHLVGYGIRRVYLSINYLGHMIEEHFGDGSRFGCRIEYLREKDPLGTGGALSLLPAKPADPLVVLNGDLLTQVNLELMLNQHTADQCAITVGVKRYVHPIPFGCVDVRRRRLIRLQEKPLIEQQVNAGIYILSPAILTKVPRSFCLMTELIEGALQRREKVGAFEIEEEWLDIGQYDQLKQGRNGTPSTGSE